MRFYCNDCHQKVTAWHHGESIICQRCGGNDVADTYGFASCFRVPLYEALSYDELGPDLLSQIGRAAA